MDDSWSLLAALKVGNQGEMVSLIGGGGKTSLLYALAAALPGRTVITTTTRIFTAQINLAPAFCSTSELDKLAGALDTFGSCLVIGTVEGEKAIGVDIDLPGQLMARPDIDHVVVEADGSRMRPVKAPAEHEPVVPPETTLLIPIAGMDALESPLDTIAHRPERIRDILGEPSHLPGDEPSFTPDDHLSPAGLARLLSHPDGGMKNAPTSGRIVPWLNKVETEERRHNARQAAQLMLHEPRIDRIILGSAGRGEPVREVWRRVAAVVLAAGESRRMGRNKLRLPWGDQTVLEATLACVKATDVHTIVVVTGHEGDMVGLQATHAGLRTVPNPDYAKGMLTSVQAAVRQLPSNIEAILVVLGDQPLINPQTINALLSAYAAHPKGLVAPSYQGQRGNPVLIDRRYFDELLALPENSAPRTLLQQHPSDIEIVDVDDQAILIDLDRPADYERWKP